MIKFFFAAKNIINLLSENDRLTIISAAGEPNSSFTYINAWQSMPSSHDTFHQTTREMKQYFFEFLQSLNKTNARTNHTLAFEYAFQLMRNATKGASSGKSPVLILYISRGYAMDAKETKNVLEAIAFGQSRLTHPVVISTCGIILSKFTARLVV